MTSDREWELERELERWRWHDLTADLERPMCGELVIATDGEARWMDMLIEGFDDMRWQGHIATHWHPVLDLPKPRKQAGPKAEPEIEF
jgi:hypothetical protein